MLFKVPKAVVEAESSCSCEPYSFCSLIEPLFCKLTELETNLAAQYKFIDLQLCKSHRLTATTPPQKKAIPSLLSTMSLFRSNRGNRSDDHEVDAYALYPAFQFSDSLLQLLESSFESYDEDATYEVCVLQFTQPPIPVLHWSIYLQSDNEGGPVYNVFYDPRSRSWGRNERQASKVSNMSSVWEGKTSSSARYSGGTVLGTIDDLSEFQSILRSTPLPGNNENCQSWVERVVRTAVNRGLLKSDALQKLRQVRRR